MLAIFNCILLSIVMVFVWYFPRSKFNSLLFIIGTCVTLCLSITFSGGISSRFIVLMPIIPIMMCLLLSRKLAIVLTSVLVVYVASIGIFAESIPDFVGSSLVEKERFPKTLWLILAIILHLTFGLVFVNIINKLTIRLESSIEVDRKTGLYDVENTLEFADKILRKLRANKTPNRLLSIMIIEATLLENNSENEYKTVLDNLAISLQKNIDSASSMIGRLSDNSLLVCIEVGSNEEAKTLVKIWLDTFARRLKNSKPYVGTNIGLISVSGSIDVDVASLRLLASKALEKAKQRGINYALDYAEMRNL